MAIQVRHALNMLKNTALDAQSLAILACLCHCVVVRSTQASMAVLRASAMRIPSKVRIKSKHSARLKGKKKLKITQGMMMHSSMRKDVSFNNHLTPSSA